MLLQPPLHRLQFVEPLLQAVIPGAVLDGAQDALQLALHRAQLRLQPGLGGPGLPLPPRDLRLEGPDKMLDQLRRQHPGLQGREHARLDALAVDAEDVGAGALRAIGAATKPILGGYRIRGAAAAAAQQVAEQEFAPVRAVERVAVCVLAHLDADLPLPDFDPLP
nr:hypothetical protein [Acidocella aromatica]